MAGNQSLGDRMKIYEDVWRANVPPNSYTVVRVDGRTFRSALRYVAKPYDVVIAGAMDRVGQRLCSEISGAVFAYVQSDEVSVLVTDVTSIHFQQWFDGNVQKLASVAASIATAEFNASAFPVLPISAHFDARAFTLPYPVEVANYFLWRQRDATRNAVSRAARAFFSQDEIRGKNSGELQEMLWAHRGVNFNDYPVGFKRGNVVVKVDSHDRTEWAVCGAPRFVNSSGEWLARTIPRHDDWTPGGGNDA